MKFTKKQIEEFEQRSLENLVDFYRYELNQVMKGRSAYEILPDGVRKRLTENGIIIKRFGGGSRVGSQGSTHALTPLGVEMLGTG